MMENYDKQFWKDESCPPVNCKKNPCACGLEKVFLSAVLGDDSDDSPIAPRNGNYSNAIVVYEANNHIYFYSKDGVPTLITTGLSDVEEAIEAIEAEVSALDDGLTEEIADRVAGDTTLQDEIDAIKNSPDVVDIVATYAALQAYDTSSLGDNDVIRVLRDETQDGQSSYYRWSTTTSTWTFIGTVGDYYTKNETDELLDDKQDTLTAGENITISNNVISATGTEQFTELTDDDANYTVDGTDYIALWLLPAGKYTLADDATIEMVTRIYDGMPADGGNADMQPIAIVTGGDTGGTSDVLCMTSQYCVRATVDYDTGEASEISFYTNQFSGTDGEADGVAGLVPAPTTSDAGKFLSADGTWEGVSGGVKTLTSDDYNYDYGNTGSNNMVALWLLEPGIYRVDSREVKVSPTKSSVNSYNPLGISECFGTFIVSYNQNNPSMGYRRIVAFPTSSGTNNVFSMPTVFFVDAGSGTLFSYNSGIGTEQIVNNLTTQSNALALSAAQGKVLKDLIDGLVVSGAGAPTTATVGTVGKLYEDTTNGDLYQCTVADATTPSYTWEQVGGGSSVNVVQTTGTSTTDVMSQNAVTSMVFADPAYLRKIQIGDQASSLGSDNITIGYGAHTSSNSAQNNVVIGALTAVDSSRQNNTVIGANAYSSRNSSIALGHGARPSADGEMNIGTGIYTTAGYNSSNYRLLSGLYDGQGDHDAVTVGQINAVIDAINTALNTSISHIGSGS